jgi:hypothetical protein
MADATYFQNDSGKASVNEIIISDVHPPLLVQMKRQPVAGQMPPV